MYDADSRLVLCNRRYLEIMNLPADFAVPGRMLQDMIDRRRETGAFSGEPEQASAEIVAAMAAAKTVSHVVETGEGRSVRVVNQPISGGGWVATFDDITDQRRVERERDRNQTFLNTVINNVPATIFVQDAHDSRYLLINEAGERYLGIPREQMIGKTARELFSGSFADLIEDEPTGVAWHSPAETDYLLSLMSPVNRAKVASAKLPGKRMVGSVYRRTRPDANGVKRQRAEVRFDDLAGCLRTPAGGSSRQSILVIDGERVRSRLLSPLEAARLMGLDDSYRLPARYNDAYHVCGDGVCAPVVRYIAETILEPILAANHAKVLTAAE